MAKDKLIDKLQSYHVDSDESKKQELIELGKVQLMKQQPSRTSVSNLFFSTFRFISLRTWVIQAIFVVLMVAQISRSSVTFANQIQHINDVAIFMQSLTGLLLFSVLFLFDELFKSFSTGMWELEQTFKYDLRQHVAMKMMIFGTIDIIVVFVMALLSQALLSMLLWRTIIYLLVPFNMICIFAFAILTLWRNRSSVLPAWLLLSLIIVIFTMVSPMSNIYALPIHLWGIAFLISTLGLAILIYHFLKKQSWEVA